MADEAAKPAKKPKPLRNPEAWREAKRLMWAHRRYLGIGLVLMLVSRVAGLVPAASSKYLIDTVLKAPGRPDLLLPLAGAVGGVGQARLAAVATLAEAVAARRGWSAVAWDRWNHGGDDPHGIVPDEMPAALDAVLALAGEPSVLVSTNDLEARIRAAAVRPAEAGAALYERPALDVDYAAPANEVEEQLAVLWSGLLGIEKVGIHDDFFGLGGHSLLATQIVGRVRDLFHLDLPLQSIFEAPTIAKYAALIEDAILAELESLTEEEAAGLMQ